MPPPTYAAQPEPHDEDTRVRPVAAGRPPSRGRPTTRCRRRSAPVDRRWPEVGGRGAGRVGRRRRRRIGSRPSRPCPRGGVAGHPCRSTVLGAASARLLHRPPGDGAGGHRLCGNWRTRSCWTTCATLTGPPTWSPLSAPAHSYSLAPGCFRAVRRPRTGPITGFSSG